MRIEHFALNVADPVAMAAWYCEHLGFSIVRKIRNAPFTHFIADSSGATIIEIYNNPPKEVPEYAAMNPLLLHIAFVSADPEADKERLLMAGATFAEEVRPDEGTHLIMMRDPWGVPIQLCKRGNPMVS
jgi:catechol 2,3-dioxygenase-like lactoylglutathione lyase family enzyme